MIQQPSDRACAFRKSSFEFLKPLASTLITAALQSQKERVHKIARQDNEGSTHLFKTYISSAKDADLPEAEILESLTLLSWCVHIFWNSLMRHIFSATELIAESYPQLMGQLQEPLHCIYDPDWFPENFITFIEVPSETIQN